MAASTVPTIALNNNVPIPQLGFGVWQIPDGQEIESAVATALQTGYRLIDTAAVYGNETGVGSALKSSDIDRSELFITTKLWNDSHDYDKALRAFDASMAKLQLDYLDMYLIHWPVPAEGKYPEAWRALERLYDEKRVRAIGVCNFQPDHLERLLQTANVIPAVNQIELHPRLQQHETRQLCAQHSIHIESWSPLMRGGELLHDPTLTSIAHKHNKTSAQIILRWHIDNGFIVIPKSVHTERIQQNFDVLDFALDATDMVQIGALDTGQRTGANPAEANFK